MRNFIYAGPTGSQVGIFGALTRGQTIQVGDALGDQLEADTWIEVPKLRPRSEKFVSTDYQVLSGDNGKQIVASTASAAVQVTLPASPIVGFIIEVCYAENSDSGNVVTVDPGEKSIYGIPDTGEVATLTVTAAGSGYSAIPTVSFTGDGTGAAASAVMKATGFTIANAGTGYAANDVLIVSGGTGTAARITVDTVNGSGVIQTAHISTVGAYSALPTNAVATTGGAGSGATFNLTYGVLSLTITNQGEGYSSAPTVHFSSGAAAATSTISTIGGDDVLNFGERKGYIYVGTWVRFSV